MTDQTRRRLGGRQPLCGCGVTSEIAPTSRPAACSERIAVSRPEPGPLTNTSTFLTPCSCALRAAFSAASCAANGVDLREPLKPTWPEDAQAMTLPCGSVIETIVLLNVLLMCAAPCGTFFFSRRRVVLPRLEVDAAAPFFAGGIGVTWPSSYRRWCAWGPCGCARWSWSAGRAPAGRGGAAGPGSSRSRSCGGCRPAPRGADHPPP